LDDHDHDDLLQAAYNWVAGITIELGERVQIMHLSQLSSLHFNGTIGRRLSKHCDTILFAVDKLNVLPRIA
jgi:hypothetical protein